MKTCQHCGGHGDVRNGECSTCRVRHLHTPEAPRRRDPDLEPAHDRPWVARSAFTGRTRRSPRT
jgi:hypothetical protein